ncbi:DUF5682 family protein [Paenibacillus radicis (ex Xue et al. 2023)]|uniref:DUF5682 family protein n=1 Tax=Paenibacillus radicis (ex Xue et al. 2023) TaxID=2972489 RepID=A0ABT1YC82_9BACL|nr:DUF5682 family protein [Paenibacillus radicis (ex Xue et al. 2023)]MCR8630014.1 DUF5682 family protein [Paenibacillus radicis (ex Xue et al. 2023)]
MAKPISCMPGDERLSSGDDRVHIFGIRHLSPTGAYQLRAYLDRIRPTRVLVEGPSDATPLIGQVTGKGVVPPVAILAYTDALPIRTLLFPFAAYSPEYQAFLWAAEHGAKAQFIDLPSDVSVQMYKEREKARAEPDHPQEGKVQEEHSDRQSRRYEFYRQQHWMYERIAELAGEPDYESYWERNFEHNTTPEAYRSAIGEYSKQMRQLQEQDEWSADPLEAAYNSIREAYMRRSILQALETCGAQDRIVVVTGAHHASALQLALPGLTDKEVAALPRSSTKLTLMPYSYYKLSTHSGYGAGNPAPAYFELLWQCLQKGDMERLPSLYLSRVAKELRNSGTYRSTASVIEGVRLAEALASLKDGSQPTWKDLKDAAVVTLGLGELSPIAEALAQVDIGTAIGELPEGVSQTPIQDDLNRHLKKLKLEKYKSLVSQDLELDLRENRRVKSEEAAYLDLHRSTFLHRLKLLQIGFAQKKRLSQDAATWAEHWVLQWSPEAEIQMVESTLKGETIEWASAFVLKEMLEQCRDLKQASHIIHMACECELPEMLEEARQMLQRITTEAANFVHIAAAARELSLIIRYGDVRRADTSTLVPLVQQLFLRGCLLLVDAAICSDEAAQELVVAMNEMHAVSQEHFEIVDDEQWVKQLTLLAAHDDRNAKLSGFAFALLLERNQITQEQCAREVSRRLSPGIPADLGAGWFEGLSMRNRYALLSRADLWQQLDAYIQSLDGDQFKRSLVFLRRAFGSFEAREKTVIAELLGEFWGMPGPDAGVLLQEPLSEEERGKLDELNDFDFGDL